MADEKKVYVSKKDMAFDAVLTVALLAFWYWVVASHVPSIDPAQIHFWGAFTAACMTGVSWVAWQLIRVVFRHQRESKKGE